jgi:phage shock protein A
MSDTRLSRIEQKIAQLEAKRSVALQRQQHDERRKRTRQAILIGQFVVDRCRKAGEDREVVEHLIKQVANSIARPKDRELLLVLVQGGFDSLSTDENAM